MEWNIIGVSIKAVKVANVDDGVPVAYKVTGIWIYNKSVVPFLLNDGVFIKTLHDVGLFLNVFIAKIDALYLDLILEILL